MLRYYLLLGTIAVLGRLILLPILPHPQPSVHDEFSYLFQAQTFVDGRLSSDQHPKWQFFETFHVLSHPRFISKYPPGQAAFLALGILLGHAHFGVMISFGLFVASVVWMLRSVVSEKWALFGGIWALLVFNVRSYWLESYWGGFVAAIGGNLVIGSFLYLYFGKRPSARWWFVIGALLLAVTRPFEGMVFVVATFGAFLSWQWLVDKQLLRKSLAFWMGPVAVAAILVVTVVGTYNWRTLGSPLRFPYVEHERQYAVTPLFWLLPIRTDVQFDDPTIETFHKGWTVQEYRETLKQAPLPLLVPFRMGRIAFVATVQIFGLPGIALPILMLCCQDLKIRILSTILLLTIFAMSLEVWILPHYLAPMTGLLLTVGVCSFRNSYDLVVKAGRKPWLVGVIISLALGGPIIESVQFVFRAHRDGSAWTLSSARLIQYKVQPRDMIAERLRSTGDYHVVFVRYSLAHNVHDEWVYNSPDIDSQPVIWARDRGGKNQELIDYYPGRTFWVVNPDGPGEKLQRLTERTPYEHRP